MATRSLNRVILIGNLTRDPELKYTPNGVAVCTFGVATNRSWTTSDGQTKDETQYHRIVAWQKLAELCGKLLNKGRKVYLEGRLTYRTFTGRDGQQRNVAEIVLDDFIVFNDGKRPPLPEEATAQKTQESVQESAEPQKEVAQPSEENIPFESEKEEPKQPEETEAENKSEDVNPDDIPF
ncbi:MAG: single-stranded DNA-binding protein [Microgenomates group bacterium]